jgi:hypothetical protein
LAFGDFTLTGTVQRLDGRPALGARVFIQGVPATVVNTAGDTIRAGLDPVKVDLTGKFSVKLPSDATTGNSTSIGFRVTTQYRNGAPGVGPVEFYARPIGSTVDLSEIPLAGGVPESLGATAANVAAAQAAADRAEAAAAVTAFEIGPTPPADTAKLWIDTSSVFSADIRTRRDLINITTAGTVTITLGATPKPDSELIWRTRTGTTILLQPVTNYTLTGTTLTVPSVVVGDSITVRYSYGYAGTDAGTAISDQPLISDSFDRANSTTTLGNTDTGQTWTVPADPAGGQPVFGITGNQAYVPTNPNNAAYATVNTGTANHTVQAKIITGLTNAQIGLWVGGDATGQNGYHTSLANLTRRTGGVNQTPSPILFSTAVATGDTLRVTRKGDTISVYSQPGSTGTFNLLGSATDANHHGTYAGLRAGGTFTTIRWDDFRVFPA